MRTLLAVCISVCFASAGQILLKIGMNRVGVLSTSASLLPGLIDAARTPAVILGLALSAAGAAFWLIAISNARLSYAYPMVALGYFVVAILSRLVFHDMISPQRWLGIAVIFVGVTLVAKS